MLEILIGIGIFLLGVGSYLIFYNFVSLFSFSLPTIVTRIIILSLIIAGIVTLIYRLRNKILLKKNLLVISLTTFIVLAGISIPGALLLPKYGGMVLAFVVLPMLPIACLIMLLFSLETWYINKLTLARSKRFFIMLISLSTVLFGVSIFFDPANISSFNASSIFNVISDTNTGRNMIFAVNDKIYFIDRVGQYTNYGLKVYDTITKKMDVIDKFAVSITDHDDDYLYYNAALNDTDSTNGNAKTTKSVALVANPTKSNSYSFDDQGLMTIPQKLSANDKFYGAGIGYSYINGGYYYIEYHGSVDGSYVNDPVTTLSYYDSTTNKTSDLGIVDKCKDVNNLCKYVVYKDTLIFDNARGITVVDTNKHFVNMGFTGNSLDIVYDIRNDKNIVYLLINDQASDKYSVARYDIDTGKSQVSTEKFGKSIISDKAIYYSDFFGIKSKSFSDLTYSYYHI